MAPPSSAAPSPSGQGVTEAADAGSSTGEHVGPVDAAASSVPERPGPRLRHSLAARISALVLLVVVATGTSALITLGQLRALQTGFDRLTEVYVQFNHNLGKAHVQAVRIGEQVRTHQQSTRDAPAVARPDAAFLSNFEAALDERGAQIAAARAPVDDALAEPERFGGAEQTEQLEEIRDTLDELQGLGSLDAMVEPTDVLEDIRTQVQIEQLFESLSTQSNRAIAALRQSYQQTQVQTERLTLGLTLGVAVIGVLAVGAVVVTLRPLRRLTESVRILGRGDWSQRIEAPGTGRADEVGHLAGEFNEMAEALEERERRLLRGERLAAAGQLAAQITHEIRNPLSSVALNVELLEDELTDMPSESRELLSKITKEVDRLTAVTEDYLRFARRPKAELAAVDLRAELEDLLEFVGHELRGAGIDISTHFPEEAAWVMGDNNQLRQAFLNLLRNAQEALAGEDDADRTHDPRLSVRMTCKQDRVLVVVADNGPGISLPEDKLDKIFEAFYTRKARGTGLGLPTVQQIVSDHGGSVRVAQTGPDGTIFEVSLPSCRPPAASVSSTASSLTDSWDDDSGPQPRS